MTNRTLGTRHGAWGVWAAAGMIAGLTLLLAGCAWFKSPAKILVPEQKSAGHQLRYADELRKNIHLRILAEDKKHYAEARAAIREGYASVARYFPADRESTPVAKLNVIEMDASLDDQGAPYSGVDNHPISRSVDKRAIQQFEQLARDYPEHTFVQAKSSYDQAMIYKRAGNFDEATKIFKRLAETYNKDQNPALKDIGRRAAVYYQKIYVVGK